MHSTFHREQCLCILKRDQSKVLCYNLYIYWHVKAFFFFLLKILKVLQRAILVEGFMMFQETWDALKKELEGDVLLGSIIWAGCDILENLFLANNGEEKILTSIR